MQTRGMPRFASRDGVMPRAFANNAKAERARLVDACVNVHAGIPATGRDCSRSRSMHAQIGNTLAILRMWRNNRRNALQCDTQTLRAYLVHLATKGDSIERRIFACRMLRNMDKASRRDAFNPYATAEDETIARELGISVSELRADRKRDDAG
jgi:hypothetical protein